MKHHSHARVTLGGKLSAVLVAAGSSVGLGNIWRFPYVAGDNGGGAFLAIYILCVLLLGLPLMLAEFTVGRASHRNAVGAFRALDSRWSFLGYNGVLAAFLILGFYLVVSGWTAGYMVRSLTGELARLSSAAEYEALFAEFIRDPWRPLVYTGLIALATHSVIALGVRKGIERSAKVLMPLLFVVLIALSVHSLLLPGGGEGLRFFFRPDFSQVTPSTVLVALGQAFFSLSISIGTMVTYASYFKPDTDLRHTALNVTILDTLVAVLAGVVIFPAVFSVGIAPSSGPSLVFITLPGIFNGMPLSMVWSSVFFLLLIVAALTSTISLHEVVTAYLHEEWHLSRRGGVDHHPFDRGVRSRGFALDGGARRLDDLRSEYLRLARLPHGQHHAPPWADCSPACSWAGGSTGRCSARSSPTTVPCPSASTGSFWCYCATSAR